MNQTNPAKPTKHIAIAIDLGKVVPWHYGCCEGILHYGREQGWSCTIDPLFMNHVIDGQAGNTRSPQCYDGLVGRIGPEVAQAAREQGIPVVNHWMSSPAKYLPGIAIDSRSGGQMVGEHLVTCGYRSLGYFDWKNVVDVPLVAEGLGRAAAEAGLAPPAVCQSDQESNLTSSRESFGQFLDEIDQWLTGIKTPVGLYVGDTQMARYLDQRCRRLGLAVPEDVGIVVWNDDASATTLSPTLSALDHDWVAVGYQAAAMLDELMQGQTIHPQHRLVPPTRVVVRESTDVFLCDDPLVKEAMRYIAEHCRQELKVVEVAEALNTSERTLYRKFDEFLGRSIKDEIKRLRVERLKLMVQETTLPLTQIAESFGFSTGTQFSRYFNKAVGMNPSVYREKFGAKEKG